ncbi:helix-turn-helix domain-containing protein [Nonomuraea sp. NPDC048882]|uniref:TetR/AcrR family transcriptional regulator n=1 Tax=unclassified Nonomuraea TaxID=2593643 RepID=UPI003402AE83
MARPLRADARRNLDALLAAAKAVFAAEGVDAPAKRIADLAGVGVGTLYRHFPQRSDLVKAVFQREVDACADVAPELSAAYGPGAALDAAAAHGEIGDGVSPEELLYAVGHLCLPVEGDGAGHSRRMVALLIDGLRFRADSSRSQRKSEMRSTASMSVARDPVEKDASAPTQPRKAPESSMICMSGLTCELPV